MRCSTLNTECRSLLCLITIPGRSWVAGIAILSSPSELSTTESRTACVVRALLPAMRERGADLFGRRKRLILADLAGYAPADPRLTLQTLDFTRTWKAWECGADTQSDSAEGRVYMKRKRIPAPPDTGTLSHEQSPDLFRRLWRMRVEKLITRAQRIGSRVAASANQVHHLVVIRIVVLRPLRQPRAVRIA